VHDWNNLPILKNRSRSLAYIPPLYGLIVVPAGERFADPAAALKLGSANEDRVYSPGNFGTEHVPGDCVAHGSYI
jgi:hypothetical protein